MYTKKLLFVLAGAILLSLICTGLYAFNVFNIACHISSEWCDIDDWITSYQSGVSDTQENTTPPVPIVIDTNDVYYTGVTAENIDTLLCRDIPFQEFEEWEIKTIPHPLSFVSWGTTYYRCPDFRKDEGKGYDTIVSYSWKTLYLKNTREQYYGLRILSDEYVSLAPGVWDWMPVFQVFSTTTKVEIIKDWVFAWRDIQITKDNEYFFSCADEYYPFHVYNIKSGLDHVTGWSDMIDNDTWSIDGQLLEMKIVPKDGKCNEVNQKIEFTAMSCTDMEMNYELGPAYTCIEPYWNYKMMYDLKTRKLFKDGREIKRDSKFTGKNTRRIYLREDQSYWATIKLMETPDNKFKYLCGSGTFNKDGTVYRKWEVAILDTSDNFSYDIMHYLSIWDGPDNWRDWYIEDCRMIPLGNNYTFEFRTNNLNTKIIDSYSFDFTSKTLENLGTKEKKSVTPYHLMKY